MNFVSKILLSCDDWYVFSIKKSPFQPEKNRKLEMFGGNVDIGETPFEGLIRELQEEEQSGILADKVKLLKLDPIGEYLIEGKTQCIYQMELTNEEYSKLKADPDESYGIRCLRKDMLKQLDRLDLNTLTPKTVLIFRQMKMIAL